MGSLVVAVDGGASKTEVVLVTSEGEVVGRSRGGPTNHQLVGVDQAVGTLGELISQARFGIPGSLDNTPTLGVFCLAGIDLPIDEERLTAALDSAAIVDRYLLRNDTFAILRSGVESGWGIATVCGTGLNCVGIGPGGETVRFPSLGELSGDFTPGGLWLGVRALGLALRSGDGRGEPTVLRELVAAHFGLADPEAVLEAIYTGDVAYGRLPELAEVTLDAAAGGDPACVSATCQLGDEIVAMTTAAIRRLDVAQQPVEVVLGGGIFDTGHRPFVEHVELGIRGTAPNARIRHLEAPPVAGAAMIGLDQVGATVEHLLRLRDQFTRTAIDGSPNHR